MLETDQMMDQVAKVSAGGTHHAVTEWHFTFHDCSCRPTRRTADTVLASRMKCMSSTVCGHQQALLIHHAAHVNKQIGQTTEHPV